MTKKEFLKKYNLTEDRFSGKEKIEGDLYLRFAYQPARGLCSDRGRRPLPEVFAQTYWRYCACCSEG